MTGQIRPYFFPAYVGAFSLYRGISGSRQGKRTNKRQHAAPHRTAFGAVRPDR